MFEFRRPVKIHAHYGAMILGRLMYWLTLPLRLLDMPYWLIAKGLEKLEAKLFGGKYTLSIGEYNKVSFFKFIFDAIFRWPVLLVFGKPFAVFDEMEALKDKIASKGLQLAFQVFTAPIWLPVLAFTLVRAFTQAALLSLFSWSKNSFDQGGDMTLPQLLSTLLILTAMRIGGLLGVITGIVAGIFNNKKVGDVETKELKEIFREIWFLPGGEPKFTAFEANIWLKKISDKGLNIEIQEDSVGGDAKNNIFQADAYSTALVTHYSYLETKANDLRGRQRQIEPSAKLAGRALFSPAP